MSVMWFVFISVFITASKGASPTFQCMEGTSLSVHKVCNGAVDCPDSSDESHILCRLQSCPKSAFRCRYGACIKRARQCDGNQDCADGSDEFHCQLHDNTCKKDEFHCESGECIEGRNVCDGRPDCTDKSDESANMCSNSICPGNAFRCAYGGCVPRHMMCDGSSDCEDGSDEATAQCKPLCETGNCVRTAKCPEKSFQCASGECVSRQLLCDGHSHCSDGSDESLRNCFQNICPPSMFRCRYGACIGQQWTCTGRPECVDWSDEDSELCGTVDTEGTATASGCRLPAQPSHGSYEVSQCSGCQPGALVIQYEELSYSCDVGHRLQGAHSVYCHSGVWVPRVPVCVPAVDDVTCPPIHSRRVTVTCESMYGKHRGWVPCDMPVPVGSVARYQCRQYYVPSDDSHEDNVQAVCQKDGTWSRTPLECKPECGKIEQGVSPLVVNGQEAQYGLWPWQTALYVLQAGNWSLWCGGSLVNEYAVVTAAHCVWKVTAETLKVAFGKFYRDYGKVQDTTQIREIKKIIMQPSYQDQNGNYGSDLAVLVLASPIEFTAVVRPVCIDWNLDFMDNDLVENNTAVVAGWGVTENDTFSDTLRIIRLRVASDKECLQAQPRDFKKYVTYTSFCAGYRNGTGVCNGDSGGGLIFQPADGNGTWVLQGIVSVSPRRLGTSFCDPKYYTIFTKVGMYIKWLESVLSSLAD